MHCAKEWRVRERGTDHGHRRRFQWRFEAWSFAWHLRWAESWNGKDGCWRVDPRHEKTERIQIQHDVEREQHHERVRRERERQRSYASGKIGEKAREDARPHTSSLAPDRVPVVEARGRSQETPGENTMSQQRVAGSGGRGKNQRNLYSSGDEARTVVVRSRRPVVDFCDSDED